MSSQLPADPQQPADDGTPRPSLSTAPVSYHQPRRIVPSRTASRTSTFSDAAVVAPHHTSSSTMNPYFPPSPHQGHRGPISPRVSTMGAPRYKQRRRTGARSASLASSVHTSRRGDEGGLLSEEEEEDEDQVHRRGLVTPGGGGGGDDVDDDDNDDDDAEGDSEEEGEGVDGARPRHVKSDDGSRRDGDEEHDPVTLRQRQSMINVEHPFGLPIWKPALYKKSRTVTRDAETALHSKPSAAGQKVLLPGNLIWTVLFGWWLAVVCIAVSLVLFLVPFGGRTYGRLVLGLGWYLLWPFGKYVEGDVLPSFEGNEDDIEEEEEEEEEEPSSSQHSDSAGTVRGAPAPEEANQSTITQRNLNALHVQTTSWNPPTDDRTPLMAHVSPSRRYGSTQSGAPAISDVQSTAAHWLPTIIFWLFFISIIAPLMLIVCVICWALVFTIPMAKLNWELIKHLVSHPLSIRFRAPPADTISHSQEPSGSTINATAAATNGNGSHPPPSRFKLEAGQAAPSGTPNSTVLLCVYRGMGTQYYKYTVGGVNILFINLLPVVFLVILDDFFLVPYVERRHEHHHHVSPLLQFLASKAFIFCMSLLSVIPLSYFIGMAVASISAQSSIGMGAVINATFGSIIEIILYAIALTQGKGLLVEGSIVGSLLAGVLLMPGASMVSGAIKKKEMKFNAKSAGVTSTMLIMAIIGTLTPTLFYQTYGNFELHCDGCPTDGTPGQWGCKRCFYQHPNPVEDPFYQGTVKALMYFCAAILVFSYLIGLWFSLRTHASQIWQNPQLLQPAEGLATAGNTAGRMSMYHRLLTQQIANAIPGLPRRELSRKTSMATTTGSIRGTNRLSQSLERERPTHLTIPPPSPTTQRRISYATHNPNAPMATSSSLPHGAGYTPLIETVGHVVQSGLDSHALPQNMTHDELTRMTRAVAVATVSALRAGEGVPSRTSGGHEVDGGHGDAGHDEGHGGHDAPSWSRLVSASVLLGCTALYAIIAEILVEVVDVVLEGSNISEKFLGVTLFALVPNTTEFMNAMSFAMNGNIALSMEIGSAYALQVCLLQIPAMVAFSAYYDPRHMGSGHDTFTLIFPRWDVISIVLSVFLLTYTYIEAKSNYHRGSMLILSYCVLMAGFYFAPRNDGEIENLPDWLTSIPEMTWAQTSRTLFNSLWTR